MLYPIFKDIIFEKIMALLFPGRIPCPLCGLPGERPGICRSCFEELCLFKKYNTCPKCGRFPPAPIASALIALEPVTSAPLKSAPVADEAVFAGPTGLCVACRDELPLFDCARAVGPYEGKLKDSIYQFKYFGHRSLAAPLAILMNELFLTEKRWQRIDALVPVPIGPARLLARRFNQTELLAGNMAKVLRLPVITLLERKHDTVTQSKLTKNERRRNLCQAFVLNNPQAAAGKRVLLVDDILTTGSTADECTATLKAGGAKEVFVLTLATGRREK